MTIFQAIISGIIQGITEFVPVSSSAHLAVLPSLMQWSDPGHVADVFLHMGSLFAVFAVFWKEVKSGFLGGVHLLTFKMTSQRRYALSLIIASLPTIIVFGFIEIFLPFRMNSLIIVSISSIFFGGLLYFADCRPILKSTESDKDISYRDAFIIGLFQIFSITPGASRLGTCVTGMRFLGYDRITSFKFSMIMSIIPVVGAVFLKSLKILFSIISLPLDGLIFSCVTAWVFGVLTLRLMLKWLQKGSFLPFVLYRIGLGIILISLAVLR